MEKMKGNDRIATGIEGLDPLIEGGFPKGSLVVLAGNPGTGKTVFGTHFCYRGAINHGEPGLYVSFAESRETLVQNISKHLNIRPVEFLREGLLRILDFATMKEAGISETLNMILSTIQEMGAKRLVIDSFSAMALAFKEPIEIRTILHTIVYKMTRQLSCTTILIVEVPIGREKVGMGMEEFIADGVIVLRRRELEGRLLRELEIAKLRGTEVERPKYLFTLHQGFRCFHPSEWRTLPPEKRRLAPVFEDRNPETISTGVAELDRLLGGGWRKGSYNLFEVGEGVGRDYAGLVELLVFSSINMGRSVYVVPSGGSGSARLSELFSKNCVEGSEERLKIAMNVDGVPKERADHIFEVNRSKTEQSFDRFLRMGQQLKEKSKDGIMVEFVGSDTLEYDYGPERFVYQASIVAKLMRESKDVSITLLKEGQRASRVITHLADTHWKFKRLHGALLLYGVVPETGAYVVETDLSKGYPETTITPIA